MIHCVLFVRPFHSTSIGSANRYCAQQGQSCVHCRLSQLKIVVVRMAATHQWQSLSSEKEESKFRNILDERKNADNFWIILFFLLSHNCCQHWHWQMFNLNLIRFPLQLNCQSDVIRCVLKVENICLAFVLVQNSWRFNLISVQKMSRRSRCHKCLVTLLLCAKIMASSVRRRWLQQLWGGGTAFLDLGMSDFFLGKTKERTFWWNFHSKQFL